MAERHIEEHEEAAELFLALAGVGLLLGAAGLLPGRLGTIGRAAATLAGLAVLGSAR